MADYTPRTADELRDILLRNLAAYLPEISTAPGSLARLEAAAYARLVADLHVRIAALDANLTPLTANESGLAAWAALLGVARRAAIGASGSQVLEVRGLAGAVVPANTTLTHRTGLAFRIPTGFTMPAAKVYLADVEAVDTGADTNLQAGEGLRFDSAPTNIEPGARLVESLTGGLDQEPLGQWRQRVVDRFRLGAQGGTRADYEAWILEASTDVGAAYVYPNKPTVGSVSVAGLRTGTGSSRALSSLERDAIGDYLETVRPISDNVIVMTTPTTRVNIDIRIDVLSSAGFDWDDSSGYTVTSYDAATGQLVFDPQVPPDLAAGSLLTVASNDPDAAGADGYPALVSAIVDTTTAVIAPFGDRSTALSWTPSAGDPIYAYSTTADRVREAVLNGYEVGCDTGDFFPGINQLGPANPGQEYGTWRSDVTLNRLRTAALSVPEVVDVTVVTPVADVLATEHEFPDDSQVEVLIPGQVLVRGS